MNNPLILTTVLTLIFLVNDSQAQTVRCDYSYMNFENSGQNISYYSCVFSTEQSNFNTPITKIDGQHSSAYDDNDVKYVVNYINNKLKTISSIFCQKFPNLEAILIGNAGIESISANAFTNCKNLIYLTIFGNNIQSLPNYVFQPLTKLRELLFYNNNYKTINPASFANMPNIHWLKLTNNGITEVPPKAFASLKSLNSLHLFTNKINKLYSDSFEGLENLYTLMLHINEIPDLPIGVFVPLKNIVEIAMRNNNITTLHSDSFGYHPKLEDIYLRDNQITSIDEKIIDNNEAIAYLNLVRDICYNGSLETRDEIKTKARKCFDNYTPRYQPFTQYATTSKPSTASNTCGKPVSGQGNVIGGSYANRGDFPW